MPKVTHLSYSRWRKRFTAEVWRRTQQSRLDLNEVAWPDPTRGAAQHLLSLHVRWPSEGGKGRIGLEVRQPVGYCRQTQEGPSFRSADTAIVYKPVRAALAGNVYSAPYYDLGVGYLPLVVARLGRSMIVMRLARDKREGVKQRAESITWIPDLPGKAAGRRKIVFRAESTSSPYCMLDVLTVRHSTAEWRTAYSPQGARHSGAFDRGEPVYTDDLFNRRFMGDLDYQIQRNLEFCEDHPSVRILNRDAQLFAAEEAKKNEDELRALAGQPLGRHV